MTMKQSINPNFVKNIGQELKKVDWPSRREALQLCGIVVIISLLLGAYIGVFDYIFASLLQKILNLK
jgi:preprotein translocase SecE subunit